MERFYNETLNRLETKIQELEIETDIPLERIESIISVITQHLSEAKEYILKKGFKNTEEEILFFKHNKPVILP